MFLEILQNSQEKPMRDSGTYFFPVNFSKFLRTPILQNTSGWLFLKTRSKIKLKPTKNLDMDVWVVRTLNQQFIRGSYTEIKFSKKKSR